MTAAIDQTNQERVFAALQGRSMSIKELALLLGLSVGAIRGAIYVLRKQGKVRTETERTKRFCVPSDASPPKDGRGRWRRNRGGGAASN
jgi:predicted ArsR family transcriptional regulator